MKVGDLVKYVSPNGRWDHPFENWRGVIIRCIDGTDENKVVRWQNGQTQSLRAMNLEVVSASR